MTEIDGYQIYPYDDLTLEKFKKIINDIPNTDMNDIPRKVSIVRGRSNKLCIQIKIDESDLIFLY